MDDEAGIAGASARREYERRRPKDEARTRARWGPLGGLAVALSDERRSTRAWSIGAEGEEYVGARLDRIVSPTIRVLHDRRIPHTRENIDHLVVTSGAIWIVDSKHFKGRPERRVEGRIFSPRVEKLIVGGRDHSKILDSVRRQIDFVKSITGGMPVRGALCFVDAQWPTFGGASRVRGIDALWTNKLIRELRGSFGRYDAPAIATALAADFSSY